MGTRESTPSGLSRRILWLATLASGTAMGLMAAPAIAGTGHEAVPALPYAALDAAQDAAQAATPAPVATQAPAATQEPVASTATPQPVTTAPVVTPSVAAPADAAAPPSQAPAATAPATGSPAPSATTPAKPGSDQDILVSARNKAPPGDPMIGINLKSYAAVQAVDKAVVGPAAMAYKKHLPSPLRMALHNILWNLREPPIAFAFLVEHKFGKAFETVGRFGINSTLGIGGMMDIAKRKPFNLPWRPNGIADALGFYGVPNGPYFFLPLIGPTTLRDLIGTTIDRVGFPALYADELRGPAYGLAVTIIGGLDDRVMIDPQVREFREHSPDPYAAMRTFYLTRRQAEIDALHGKPPLKDKISDYDMPGAKPGATTTPVPAPAAPAPATPVPATTPTPDTAQPATQPVVTTQPEPATPAPATAPATDTPKP